MKITIIVEKTKTGYSAYAEKYPVYTVGKSLEELKSNILEAVNLSLEKSGKSVTENDLKIVLDLPQFFEFYKVIRMSTSWSDAVPRRTSARPRAPSMSVLHLAGVRQFMSTMHTSLPVSFANTSASDLLMKVTPSPRMAETTPRRGGRSLASPQASGGGASVEVTGGSETCRSSPLWLCSTSASPMPERELRAGDDLRPRRRGLLVATASSSGDSRRTGRSAGYRWVEVAPHAASPVSCVADRAVVGGLVDGKGAHQRVAAVIDVFHCRHRSDRWGSPP